MKAGGQHSIHFPAGTDLVNGGSKDSSAGASKLAPVPQVNVLQRFADALRDVELCRERLRGLVISGNRHGDLQVVRSALLRSVEAVNSLIDAEENS